MNCITNKERISQFMDDELQTEELQPMFQHLGECEECRKFFVQTKTIRDGIKNFEQVEVPESINKKFDVLAMEEKKQPLMHRKFTVSVPSALLSGIVVLMISILFVSFINTIQFDRQKPEADYFKQTTLQTPYYN